VRRPIPKPIRARWAGLVAAVAVILGGWYLAPGAGAALEGLFYDRVQRSETLVPPAKLRVVAIDGASTARVGPWPWPEPVLTKFVAALAANGARVIAFATPLPTFSSDPAPGAPESETGADVFDGAALAAGAGDPTLATTMFTHGAVVVAIDGDRSGARSRTEATAHGDRRFPTGVTVGHLQFVQDADGVIRGIQVEANVDGIVVPALPLAIVARFLDRYGADTIRDSQDVLTIDSIEVPVASGTIRPRFALAAQGQAFDEIPAWQVLERSIDGEAVRDAVVIVGHAGERLSTPISQSQPLSHVVAATVASILAERAIAHPLWARAFEWLAALTAVAFVALVVPALGTWRSLAASLVLAGAFIATDLILLAAADLWLALAIPALAVLAGWAIARAAFLDVTRAAEEPARPIVADQTESLRQLSRTFRDQGRLELAFETLRQCPTDSRTLDELYELGLELERQSEPQRAAEVFAYLAGVDPAFRDAAARGAVARASQSHGISTSTGETEDPVELAEEPSIALPQPADSVAPDLTRLGRYEIETELGKGAMGVVYLGRDPRINRVVAIKAIALAEEFEESDLAEAKARFFREAEMAGRLNHPGIVTIYDVGEEGRLAYIAMEFLRGVHLSHYTEPDTLLPPDQILELVARVAEALDYAHRENVVHRDIKPANIMFNSDTDELKITDFGIARLTDTSRTKTGIVLGTPSFMSPEQLEGRRLDGRSDLFSLGVSLYQLLTGQLPFRADSMTRLMQKIATEIHTPIRSVRPDLPEAVEAVISRALAKNPEDRYRSGAEFAAALRDCAARVAA
jgi:CHASE2 domain-containing sensor protein/predicted Ser/Thr protein kinase